MYLVHAADQREERRHGFVLQVFCVLLQINKKECLKGYGNK